MSELQALLPNLRARIAHSLGKRSMNEQNTKATLVTPVLRALGWDTEDIEEVVHEYKPRRADKPVDYALLSQRTPRLFIEAKALGQNLDDRKWAGQIMGYASVAGVEWIVLTNGDEWRIYNTHAAVAVDEKLFRSVRISAEGTLAQETLALLAKAEWDGRRIEQLWQQQFVDRKVRTAVEGMFGAEADGGLVHAIRRRCPVLTAKDIKASLARARIALDFPQALRPGPGPEEHNRKKRKRPPTETSGITQQALLKAGIINAPLALERVYKGHSLKATMNADGRIVHEGRAFDSLSAAGGSAMQAVLGGDKPPACNGWGFWHYRDQSGKLVPVDALRKRYLRAKGSA